MEGSKRPSTASAGFGCLLGASFFVLELINCAKNKIQTNYVIQFDIFFLDFHLPGAFPCA